MDAYLKEKFKLFENIPPDNVFPDNGYLRLQGW